MLTDLAMSERSRKDLVGVLNFAVLNHHRLLIILETWDPRRVLMEMAINLSTGSGRLCTENEMAWMGTAKAGTTCGLWQTLLRNQQ